MLKLGTPRIRSINYEAKESFIFSFVCLTTIPDECKEVGSSDSKRIAKKHLKCFFEDIV